jgi:hypothetical protein
MRKFLERISSRKFLTAVGVQVASVVALFWPEHASETSEMVMRVAALVTLLLAAMGYGSIEAVLDTEHHPGGPEWT